MRGRAQGAAGGFGGKSGGRQMKQGRAVMRGPSCRTSARDQAFTLSLSALAMVTLTTLSAGLVIISWVCGLRT